MKISITECGAVADGQSNNAKAIQSAIDQVSNSGGGTVLIPTGTFLSGSIELKANVNLHLSIGAVLLASGNYDDYTDGHNIKNLTCGEVD